MKEKLFDENQSLSYRKTFLESNCQEEVETFAKVSGRDVFFVLLSPDAAAIEEDIRDMVIEDQLAAIRDISTDIAIIEQ